MNKCFCFDWSGSWVTGDANSDQKCYSNYSKSKKNVSNFCFTDYIFSLKFVGILLVSSVISSHAITESSIILAKYLPFLQLHVAGFQI